MVYVYHDYYYDDQAPACLLVCLCACGYYHSDQCPCCVRCNIVRVRTMQFLIFRVSHIRIRNSTVDTSVPILLPMHRTGHMLDIHRVCVVALRTVHS